MKKFIRENPTLAFGLGLPLLIVLVFMAASMLPRIGAIAPKYAVVFATDYYQGNRGVVVRVENHKPRLFYIGQNNCYNRAKFYIYDPAKDSVRELPVSIPLEIAAKRCGGEKDSDKITPIPAPEFEALTVDTSTIAPDGYEFTNYYESYSRDPFFGGFLFGSSYHNGVALKRGSYTVPVPHTEPYGNTQFIGWVVQ